MRATDIAVLWMVCLLFIGGGPAWAADEVKRARFDLITWDRATRLIEEPTREGIVSIQLALPAGVEDQHYDLILHAAGKVLKPIRDDLRDDFFAAEAEKVR